MALILLGCSERNTDSSAPLEEGCYGGGSGQRILCLWLSPSLTDLGALAVGDTLQFEVEVVQHHGEATQIDMNIVPGIGDAFVVIPPARAVVPGEGEVALSVQFDVRSVGLHYSTLRVVFDTGELLSCVRARVPADTTPPDDDLDQDGQTVADGDCNDTSPWVQGGGPEMCDGVDNDCDGVVDEVCALASECSAEVCDGIDNDCDDVVDEGCDWSTIGFPCTPSE